jgi:hypothetical protein
MDTMIATIDRPSTPRLSTLRSRLGAIRRPRGGRFTAMVVLSLAVMLTAAAARPQLAAARTGVIGWWEIGQPICTVAYPNKVLYVPVPRIWSSNRTYGAGNDLQNVRYWTRLVDLANRPITTYAYGGQGTSNDNRSASLPYISTFSGQHWQHKYAFGLTTDVKVQVLVAWYDTAWRLLGTDEPIVQRYANAGSFGSVISYNNADC